MKHAENKNIVCWLAAILLFAIALRAGACLLKTRVQKDAVVYLCMARDMADGQYDSAFSRNMRIPPLFPFTMALGVKMGLGVEFAGRVISVLSGALLLIPVFLIARKFMHDKLALLSSLVVATHPYLIRINAEIMRDSLFMLLLFCSLACAVYATDPRKARLWYLAGLFAGLSVLARSEGIEVLLVLVVWICYEIMITIRTRRSDRERDDGQEDRKSLTLYRIVLHYFGCFFCFLFMYLIVTVPVQLWLNRTPSTWTVVDSRIHGIVDDFFTMSKKEVAEQETD